ncbi:methyltransferase [Marinobacter halodurans]|uniref:Methyltransferase n=1 Tax=Marinobacter halodurans TaxID=2528979 RepID=A0ABY1ZJW2_9GAMM|nr:methyltransferase [Marinobacter halodurans]TBW55498.1 methyltransferase [Marinobacter halodurans]
MTVTGSSSHDRAGRWSALDGWLADHADLWQPAPFSTPAPDWCRWYPGLATFLEGLTDAEVDAFEADSEHLVARLSAWLPTIDRRRALLDLPDLAGDSLALPETRAVDMPGRKRLQAGAFAAALRALEAPVLDWCCGKGHLARTLAPHAPGALVGYEWDPALVADGNALAARYGDPVTLVTRDVLDPDMSWSPACHGVALHACGDLHRRLIEQGARHRWPRLSIAPCCFHLTRHPDYQPLSQRVREQRRLEDLSRETLRLAVRETVTAPARIRRQTRRTQIWRLGFDALQRHVRGEDSYLPVPPHPTRLNDAGFAAFCHWAAERKGMTLPPDTDLEHWLALGRQRQSQVRRHELLRHLFRRPLELWLVLDDALYLEEQGYTVTLGTFCERHLTPRNLLLDARLAS